MSAADFRSIIADALSEIAPGSKVLAIISDKTRDDNTELFFPIAAEILAEKNIAKLDALVAQGTHSPMNDAEKLTKIGAKNLSDIPNLRNIFDTNGTIPKS